MVQLCSITLPVSPFNNKYHSSLSSFTDTNRNTDAIVRKISKPRHLSARQIKLATVVAETMPPSVVETPTSGHNTNRFKLYVAHMKAPGTTDVS